jgi:hypothetical protein
MAGGKTEVTLAEIRDQLNKDKVELFNFIVVELGLPETVNLKQLEKLATVFQFASALPKELQKSAKFSGTAIREYEPVTSNEVSDFLSWAFKSDRAQVMNGTKAGSITGTKDSAKSDDDATRKLLREKSKEYSEAKRKGHYAEAAKTAATILETLRVKHPKLYPAGTPEEDVDNAKWLEVYRGQKDDILEKLEKLTTMKEKSALLPLIAELEKALNDKAIFEEESTLELLYAKIDLVIKIAKLKKAAGVPAGEVQAFLDEKSKGIWALGFWDETNQKAKAGLALELANLKADLFIKKEEGAACPLPAGLGVDSELDVIADNWDKELIKSEKGASAEKTKVIFWQMIEQFDTKAEDKDYVFTTEDAINIYMLHALFIGKGDKIGPKDMVKGDTPKVFKGGQEKVLKFFKQVFSNAPTPAPASASAAKVPAGAKKSKGTEKKAGKEKGAPGTGTTPKAENAKGADNKTDGSTASYTVSDIKTSYEGKDVIYKATVSISGGKGNVVVVEMEKGKANALSKKQIATIDGGKWTDLKTTGRVGSNYATIKKQIIDGLKAQKIEIQ